MSAASEAQQPLLSHREYTTTVAAVHRAECQRSASYSHRALANVEHPIVEPRHVVQPNGVIEARGVADGPDGAVGPRRHAQQRTVGGEHEHGDVEQGIVRKSSAWPDPYPAVRRQAVAAVLGVRVADAKLDGDVAASLHAESRRA